MRHFVRYGLLLAVLLSVSTMMMALTPTPQPPRPLASPTPPIPFMTQPPRLVTPTATIPQAEVLRVGEAVEGNIFPNNPTRRYIFENDTPGQVVVFRVRKPANTGADLYVETYGSVYAQFLNRTEDTFTWLFPFEGQYTLVFNLYISSNQSSSYAIAAETPDVEDIAYGETVEVTFTQDVPAVIFAFEGEQGDQIVLSATAEQTVPVVFLMRRADDGYQQLLESYGGGGGGYPGQPPPFPQQANLITLPEDGSYAIVLSAQYVPVDDATVTLSLDLVDPTPIAYGDTVTGEITDAQRNVFYSFEGDYGDVLDVRVNTDGELDLTLTVLDATDGQFILAADDDGGLNFDPEIIRLPLYNDGMFILQVQPFTAGVNGEFELVLELSDGYRLEDGVAQRVQLAKRQDVPLAFEAEAGEEIRLLVEAEIGPLPFINVFQQETQILNLGSPELREIAVDFIVPEDGVVLIRLDRNYAGPNTSSVANVTIERRN